MTPQTITFAPAPAVAATDVRGELPVSVRVDQGRSQDSEYSRMIDHMWAGVSSSAVSIVSVVSVREFQASGCREVAGFDRNYKAVL